jgi:hypothetical protein
MARKIPKGGLPTRSNGPAPRTPAAKFKGSSIKSARHASGDNGSVPRASHPGKIGDAPRRVPVEGAIVPPAKSAPGTKVKGFPGGQKNRNVRSHGGSPKPKRRPDKSSTSRQRASKEQKNRGSRLGA